VAIVVRKGDRRSGADGGGAVVLRAVFRRVRSPRRTEIAGGTEQVGEATPPASHRVDTSAPASGRRGVRTWVAGLSAIAIAAASFVGLSATVASAATTSVTLTVTSGSFGVQGNAPATLPPPGSITGQVSSTTGAITGATLTLSPYHATNTGSTETIFLTQLTPARPRGRSTPQGTSASPTHSLSYSQSTPP
jgi:hypothetical protein